MIRKHGVCEKNQWAIKMGKVAITGTKSEQREVSDCCREHCTHRRLGQTATAQLESIWAAAQTHSKKQWKSFPLVWQGQAQACQECQPVWGSHREEEVLYGPMPATLCHFFLSMGSSGNRVWLAKRILIFNEERVKFTHLSSGLQNIKIDVPFHSTKKHTFSQVMQLDVWFVFTPFSSIPFLIFSISVHFMKV